MAIYKTFDAILQNAENEQDAINYARGMVWSECEISDQNIAYARHVDTIDGVGVFYDYGADYYFFTDETDEGLNYD